MVLADAVSVSVSTVTGMDFNAGDHVERRHGRGESRFGRILGRYHPGYELYYVNVGIGMTHIDWARDLRPGGPGAATTLVVDPQVLI